MTPSADELSFELVQQLAAICKLRQRIRDKNRFNLASMVALLIGNWCYVFVALCTALLMVLYYPSYGLLAVLAAGYFLALFGIFWFAMMERGSIGFGRLKPMLVSMYDDQFWGHERHWKFCGSPLMSLFKGTPLKNMISRLLGVRLEKKGAYALGDPIRPLTTADVRDAWRLVALTGWLSAILCALGVAGVHALWRWR